MVLLKKMSETLVEIKKMPCMQHASTLSLSRKRRRTETPVISIRDMKKPLQNRITGRIQKYSNDLRKSDNIRNMLHSFFNDCFFFVPGSEEDRYRFSINYNRTERNINIVVVAADVPEGRGLSCEDYLMIVNTILETIQNHLETYTITISMDEVTKIKEGTF
jgi:hypothetical protein